jgi:hypothetical protein
MAIILSAKPVDGDGTRTHIMVDAGDLRTIDMIVLTSIMERPDWPLVLDTMVASRLRTGDYTLWVTPEGT